MRVAQSALGEVGYGDEDGCPFLTDRKALHPDLLAPLHEDKLICVRARPVVFLEAAGRRVPARRLRRGSFVRLRDSEAFRIAAPICVILAIATLLRTWQLTQNGFGRQYYAAAVRSMMDSWHNFLFNAFDPAGFVTIDKPPVAIWLQAASAKLLGFNEASILLAQVVAGLAGIAILYMMVRRSFGQTAAAFAALALALSPVNVAVDRSNNTESCLILVLLVAAWLGMRAAETGRAALLCAAMAAVGIGFNVKMGAALVLVPVLALTFSVAWRSAPLTWHIKRQAIAGVVLVVVSLSWVVFFDLTPAGSRPYAGSTRNNSMIELALVHNGAARFQSLFQGARNDADATQSGTAATAKKGPLLVDGSPTGPFRLFRPTAAAQFAWLLPLALVGLFFAWSPAAAIERTASRRISAGVWSGWLVSYWGVLSFAGGPVHTYYVAILGPPLAVLSGIAVAELWSRWNAGLLWRPALPLLALGTAAWQAYVCYGQSGTLSAGWLSGTWIAAVTITLLCGGALFTLPQRTRTAQVTAVIAIAAALVPPSLTAASVIMVRPNVAAPVADMMALQKPLDTRRTTITAPAQSAARRKLADYLIANRDNADYIVAVPNANIAAPLIIATGMPVMAMGGYLGDDPILRPQDLERLVADRKLRFVMLGGFTLAPEKAAVALEPIAQWVKANGRPVHPSLWRLYGAQSDAPYRIRLGEAVVSVPPPVLFDLRR